MPRGMIAEKKHKTAYQTRVKMTLFRISVLLTIGLACHLWAGQPLVEIRTQVDTNRITVGGRIHYTVEVNHADTVRIEHPGEGLALEPFEVKDFTAPGVETLENNRLRERFEYTLTAYDTGRFVIPAFPLLFYADSSGAGEIITGRALPVEVISVLPAGDSLRVRDIRAPEEIPFDWAFWGWMTVSGLLLLLAAWFIYRAWKRKQETGSLFRPPPPPPPAHEVALQALAELYRGDLLEQGRHKEFYSRLSEILRAYLEGRYFIAALESTTDEILMALEKHLPQKEIARIAKILRVADLVKFAKHVPDIVTTRNIMRDTEQFVLDTRLVFEEPRPQEAGTAENSKTSTKEDAL